MNRRWFAALAAVPLALSVAGTGAADASPTAPSAVPAAADTVDTDGVYVVQMADLPVIAYDGSTPGYAATKPSKGKRFDSKTPAANRWAANLKSKHGNALRAVGANSRLYDYAYTYNGFAARLTGAQAKALRSTAGVLAVSKQQTYTVDTSTTPGFLGLTDKRGLWNQLGGTKSAGEGIVIGVIDSGIWPESLSFSDRVGANGAPVAAPGGTVTYSAPASTAVEPCETGEDWSVANCNNKLVVARYFNAGQGGNAAIDRDKPWEFNSPRDYNGHGTHTASTSGGNHAVPVTGAAAGIAPNGISGIAPRARIAAYKALWSTESGDTAGGTTSDLVAAIDQSVADGVNVINYSVSGSQTNFADPVEISFLFAADAGIFVSASAGNSGPTASTVAHPSPWITTVAAGTHNRDSRGSVTLGNGTTYNGASLAANAVTAPLVDSTAVGKAGADPAQVALCYSSADGGNVLDPAKVAGKIVVCDRGVTGRTNKSLAVQEAGGVGMILVNTSANSLNADLHVVPTVHLADTDRAAVKAYAATSGATATINKAELVTNAAAPFTAAFSSRGPLIAGGGDLLKPDVIAPGQDILAAVSPSTNRGYGFNLLSGTSMSAPHVAGLAALLQDLHPTWSPMAVKSALMTTGYDVLDDSTAAEKAFSQGAGHVKPNAAADPGLVYDSSWNDWLAFLCGSSSALSANTCNALKNLGYSTDASDFNGPSIAVGDLAGVQTVTRKVTNVGSKTANYKATASVPGLKVTVTPERLKLAPGSTGQFTVRLERTGATLNQYTAGSLIWKDGEHSVRSPIVVRPVALAAPGSVAASPAGTSYDVTFGYTGPFSASARGLVPVTETPGSVVDDPTDDIDTAPASSLSTTTVSIPAGTTYARFALFGSSGAGDDLDIYVYRGTTLVALSGNGGSVEEANLVNPQAGDYKVVVHGFAVTGSTASFVLNHWLLGSADAGNMTVSSPATATTGGRGTITLGFPGLATGKWLGSVAYGGDAAITPPTVVRVDVP